MNAENGAGCELGPLPTRFIELHSTQRCSLLFLNRTCLFDDTRRSHNPSMLSQTGAAILFETADRVANADFSDYCVVHAVAHTRFARFDSKLSERSVNQRTWLRIDETGQGRSSPVPKSPILSRAIYPS